MKTVHISSYPSCKHQFASWGFEDVFYTTKLTYSIRQMYLTGSFSTEIVIDALQKSLQVCCLLDIDSKHHFKKVYVYDAQTGVLHADWLMSRNGFNLMMMQMPSINEKVARWLWKLSDL